MSRKIIGITGSLATGKTAVADMFVEKGAVKIDADEVAHELLARDEDVRRKVIALFGEGILTEGAVDRRKLAGIVFYDRRRLDELCHILHPPIIRLIREQVKLLEDKNVVIDAPLLVESGLHEFVDVVIVVTAGHDTQLNRAASRGITEEEAENIISSQLPLSEKIEFADYTIDNDSDINVTKKGVDEIWKKM